MSCADDCKGRNVVEHSFHCANSGVGIVTRYDKHNVNYRGWVVLNAVIAWLKLLRDTA